MALRGKDGFSQIALDHSRAVDCKQLIPVPPQREAIEDDLKRDTNAQEAKPGV